ncbi:MAG: aldo/keto reductase [Bacteroidota bacterium]
MANTNPIGFGTAAIGRPQYINIRQEEGTFKSLAAFKQQGIATLDKAYELGVRYFDTAPGYGMAEELLTEWLRNKDDLSLEVATKWGYTYTANFDPTAEVHEVKEHSLAKLNEQWKRSSSLLPCLSTYQIHSATFETGVLGNESVLHRLAELRDLHQLKIGLTTSGANHTEVLKYAAEVEVNGALLFEVFQVTYNLFDQSAAAMAYELARQGRRVVVKEALANGRIFANTAYPHYQSAYSILEKLAQKYEVGVDAIALRFCVDSIPVFSVLSGAAQGDHLVANLKANQFELSPAEISELRSLAVDAEAYWSERKQLGWN